MRMRKGHQAVLPIDTVKVRTGPKQRPANFYFSTEKHLKNMERAGQLPAKVTKNHPVGRSIKKDTRKLKEAVQEKYSYQCPHCHKWLSREQRRGHPCDSGMIL